eukprot:1741665-Amphidinium_carterae.1
MLCSVSKGAGLSSPRACGPWTGVAGSLQGLRMTQKGLSFTSARMRNCTTSWVHKVVSSLRLI